MSNDIIRVLPGAPERASQPMTPLRKFMVPYAIEGALEIEATDAETAKYLADNKPRRVFEEEGALTVFDAEPVDATQ